MKNLVPLFCLLAFLLAVQPAAAKNLLIIGDSLSKEYKYEADFLEETVATDARNWCETLDARRDSEFNFGDDDFYADIRLYGHEYNWSVPGSTARDWKETYLATSGFTSVRTKIRNQLKSPIDRVVIWLGGNDIREKYGAFYNGTENPQTWINQTYSYFEYIVNFVTDSAIAQERAAAGKAPLQVVLVGIPHLGGSPDKNAAHPYNVVKTGRVTAALDQLNERIRVLAEAKGAGYADTYGLSKELVPTHVDRYVLGGFISYKDAGPSGENDPSHLFLSDGFHPSTTLQAVFSQIIIDTFNKKFNLNIPRLKNREIKANVLNSVEYPVALNQTFAQFMAAYGVTAPLNTANADFDHDGIPNLNEFALDMDPTRMDVGFLPQLQATSAGGSTTLKLAWQPYDPTNSLVGLAVEESTNLTNWVPSTGTITTESAVNRKTITRTVTTGQKLFLRLKSTLP